MVAGDIALIDHLDIDRVSAEELIAAGAAAVLNCRPSSGGSYPNMGPQLLVQAGLMLVDLPDDSLFGLVADGDPIVVRSTGSGAGEVLRRGEVLARGQILEPERVLRETEARRQEVGEALERFALNTIEHMREERELLTGRIQMPRFQTDFRDRSILVVVRGVDVQRDLRALRPFIRDMRPLIVAVDGGADVLLEEGLTPRHDRRRHGLGGRERPALRSRARRALLPDGRSRARPPSAAANSASPTSSSPRPGTSQDVAMLIAAEKGARLIVCGGSPVQPRRVPGPQPPGDVVDAPDAPADRRDPRRRQGSEQALPPRPGLTPLLVVIAAGMIAMIAVIWMTPALRDVAQLLWIRLHLLLGTIS